MADSSSSVEAVVVVTGSGATVCPSISTSIAPRRARRLFVDKIEPVSEENDINVKCDGNQVNVEGNADDESADDDRRKIRRGWNVWTPLETRAFFNALAYHGKDFLAIQSYMQNKGLNDSSKKSKPNVVSISNVDGDRRKTSASTPPPVKDTSTCFKTRDQVRHYYYRSWHKISGALSDIVKVAPSPNTEGTEAEAKGSELAVDKSVLELYGLINYGEMWKKIGSRFDAKMKGHLKELVLEGVTVIKGLKVGSKSVGSKGIKIKTPNCRALKKINGFTVESENPGSPLLPSLSSLPNHSLPDELMVELVPTNNESFVRVQSLAQNPRVKTKVRLDRRVSSLIHFLETKKWNENSARWAGLNFYAGGDQNNPMDTNHPSKKCIRLKLDDNLVAQLDNDIKLARTSSSDKNPTSSSANFAPPSQILHFKYYLANTKCEPKSSDKSDLNSAKKKGKLSSSEDVKDDVKKDVEVNDESCSSTSSFAPFKETVKKLNQLNEALSSVLEPALEAADPPDELVETRTTDLIPSSIQDEVSLPPEDVKLSQWLRLKEQRMEPGDSSYQQIESHEQSMDHTNDTKSVTHEFLVEAESIKKGFMSKSSSGVTFGELYCLLKYPSKVTFVYEFIREPRSSFGSAAIEEALESLAEQKKKSMVLDRLIDSLGVNLILQKKIQANHVSMSTSMNSTVQSPVVVTHQNKTVNGNGQASTGPSPPKGVSSGHNFLMPIGPAPRSAILSNVSDCPSPVMGFAPTPVLSQFVHDNCGNQDKRNLSTKRQRVVCEDPQLLQDAIKQLNTNRHSRKRPRSIRPTPIGPVAGKSSEQIFAANQNTSPPVIVQQPVTPLIDGKQIIISNGGSMYQVIQSPNAPIQIIGQNSSSGFQQQSPIPAGQLPFCISSSTFSVANMQPTLLLTSNIQPVVSAVPSQSIAMNDSSLTSSRENTPTNCGSRSGNASQQSQVARVDVSATLEEVPPSDVTSNHCSTSQDNFLSSLNDLSLPDLSSASSSVPNLTSASSSGVTITTLNNPFIGSENSNSSISEFITFASNGVRPGDLNSANNDRLERPPSTTPSWLHDHLSNSNSLGLSNLFELK